MNKRHGRRKSNVSSNERFSSLLLVVLLFCATGTDAGTTHIHPNGLILENTDQVLLVQHQTTFDLHLVSLLPELHTNFSSRCDQDDIVKETIQDEVGEVKKMMIRLFNQFMTSGRAQAVEDIQSFCDDLTRSVENFQHNTTEDRHVMTSLIAHTYQTISRRRRALQYLRTHWTLSGWTEDQLAMTKHWTANHFEQTNQRINSLGLIIKHNHRDIQNVANALCKVDNAVQLNTLQMHVTRAMIQYFEHITAQLEVIEQGQLPSSVTNEFLMDYCTLHFRQNRNSTFCETVSLRRLFSTKLKSLGIDRATKSIVITVEVEAPESEVTAHETFLVTTIPILKSRGNGTTNHRYDSWSLVTGSQVVAASTETGALELVAFKQCNYVMDHYQCQRRASSLDENCLRASLTNTKNIGEYCFHERRTVATDCVFKRLQYGILVSSAVNKSLHDHEEGTSYFPPKSTTSRGLIFLANSKSTVKSIDCNGRMLKTRRLRAPELHVVIDRYRDSVNFTIRANPTIRGLEQDVSRVSTELAGLKNGTIKTKDRWSIDEIATHMTHFDLMKIAVLVIAGLTMLAVIAVFTTMVRYIVNQCRRCRSKETVRRFPNDHHNQL